MIGKVKWFDEKKGFGFIDSELGKDVFVHASKLSAYESKKLVDGELVEFGYTESVRGLQATWVTKIS